MTDNSPLYWSHDAVLDVFRDLPNHHGWTESQLDSIDAQFGITLPNVYRTMMRLDASRLIDAGIVAGFEDLQDNRNSALELLVEDGHAFRLARSDFVFAWNEIYSFIYFSADGNPDPEVMEFNYYSQEGRVWIPTVRSDSLKTYFANSIRSYLKL